MTKEEKIIQEFQDYLDQQMKMSADRRDSLASAAMMFAKIVKGR